MPTLIVRAAPGEREETSPAETLLDATGLTPALETWLLQEPGGRSFTPTQLDPSKAVVQQATLLLRPEPVGGAEPLLANNAHRFRAQAVEQINRALARASGTARPLLQDLEQIAQKRATAIAARVQQLDRQYAQTHERLRRWQNFTSRGADGQSGAVLRWLLGGDERLSLPEAVVLWNDREYQARDRAAAHTAHELHQWLHDMIVDLSTQLTDRLAEVRQAQTAALQALAQLHEPAAVFAPWTLQVSAQVVSAALVERADVDALAVALLQASAAERPEPDLLAQVRVLAAAEAERLLAPLSLVDLIEIEAGAAGSVGGDDPLLLVGQALLEQVGQPSWALARHARPRTETLQVTPDGAPVYHLEGLSSASYGGSHDRLGFVQVQLQVASADLALMHHSDAAFQAALEQRNLYVIDDLACAWEQRTSEVVSEMVAAGHGRGGNGVAEPFPAS